MDIEVQFVIGRVIDLVLTKGNIADGKVIEVTAVCGFKPCHGDVCLGIKLLGDPSADGIQLHTIQAAVIHFLWEHTEEIADAHCRFQNIACFESHVAQGFIHCPDDRGTGVVGIEGGCTGGIILCRGEKVFQFLVFR